MARSVPVVIRVYLALLKASTGARTSLLTPPGACRWASRQQRAAMGARGNRQELARQVRARRGRRGPAVRGRRPAWRLIEIHRETSALAAQPCSPARGRPRRFLLFCFCDDLSFDGGETPSYKSLKAVLGSVSRAGNPSCCSTPPRTAAP